MSGRQYRLMAPQPRDPGPPNPGLGDGGGGSGSSRPPSFPQYQRLPNELKLLVWDFHFATFWAAGAHRFRLVPEPKDPTKLRVLPLNKQPDDPAFWRERLFQCRVDRFSFDCLLRFERRNTVFYAQKSHHHYKDPRDGWLTAGVGKGDLITFRLHYGTSQAALALLGLGLEANRRVFAGIRMIGVELDFQNEGWINTPRYKPFACPCSGNVHEERPCGPGFMNFVRFFEDLEVFFFIVNVNLDTVIFSDHMLSLMPENRLILPPGRQHSQVAALAQGHVEWRADLFMYFYERAVETGNYFFKDRAGAYCEVPEDDARRVLREHVLHGVRKLRRAWADYKTQHRPGNDVKFRVLLWHDLRGVTIWGQERRGPLRTFAPWEPEKEDK